MLPIVILLCLQALSVLPQKVTSVLFLHLFFPSSTVSIYSSAARVSSCSTECVKQSLRSSPPRFSCGAPHWSLQRVSLLGELHKTCQKYFPSNSNKRNKKPYFTLRKLNVKLFIQIKHTSHYGKVFTVDEQWRIYTVHHGNIYCTDFILQFNNAIIYYT